MPRETRATCSSCLMASAEWPREARDVGPFESSLKCCTYEPFLPNFSVGRILGSGSATLEALIADGRLTPLGLIPQNSNSNSGPNLDSNSNFGRDASKRCAFLQEGRCSIWRDRPSVCRSYFCVSDSGSAGQAQWREAERLGNEAEWTLAHELLWEIGFTPAEVSSGTFAEWRGREKELFIEISRRVSWRP